jgi:hypothetical protein
MQGTGIKRKMQNKDEFFDDIPILPEPSRRIWIEYSDSFKQYGLKDHWATDEEMESWKKAMVNPQY